MKEKLTVVATVVAHPGKENLLREALLALVPTAQKEPGFIQYDLHESIDRPGTFLFYEIWEDEHSLNLHSNTESMKAHSVKASPWVKSVVLEKYRRIS
jgi:quinol monooxygenase YgiN